MNCFLTPDRKPFFGGTYFPPEDKYGRPSFPIEVLQHIGKLWETRHGDVVDSARPVARKTGSNDGARSDERPTTYARDVLTNAAAQIKQNV